MRNLDRACPGASDNPVSQALSGKAGQEGQEEGFASTKSPDPFRIISIVCRRTICPVSGFISAALERKKDRLLDRYAAFEGSL